jgi:uncharacterized protein YcfL
MKKLLLLTAILLVSCSKQDEVLNCDCGKVIQSSSFNALGNQFSVFTVRNNCTGIEKQTRRDGIVNVGTQICNY